jgi:ribosomal protein S18 acetylase RimI-like enzyme
MRVRVEIAVAATPELLSGMQRLIPQLSRSNPPPTLGQLHEQISSDASELFLAYDGNGRLVGTATLVVFRIPTALRAWIEDVVTDDAARGQGVGTALTKAMLDRARERGCKTVDLTSRPSREEANRLYKKLGFEERDTNVYRLTLKA